MKYTQFSNMPIKGRISWVQEKLIKLGYLKDGDSKPTKRDKGYIKALQRFQEAYGMTPNADMTEELFEKLNYN